MNSFNPMSILSPTDIERIQQATEHLLETTGFAVEHEQLLKKARAAGAKVDAASGRVRIPAPLFRELLAQIPACYRIRGMLGDEWEIGSERQYGLGIVTDPWIIDYETQQPRRPRLDDLRRHTIVAQQLDPIVTISRMDFPVVEFEDDTSSLRALEAHLLHHVKHYTVLPASLESFEQWLEILSLIARGDEIRQWLTVGIAVVSPLALNELNAEILLRSAERGFVVLPTICPMAGSTAPYSLAGVVLQANIEVLMVAIMAQMVRPGTPFLYSVGVSVTDMRSGQDLYYTMDKVLWKIAFAQLGRAYRVPTGAECGGSLTYRFDQQSGAEGMLFMLAAHASGAHMLAGYGSNHNANGMSAEMMVIQNAYRNAARFLTRGIDTDAFHLAVESIERAGPHGNFLTDDLTLALLHKNQFFQDDIFDYSGGYRDGQSMLRRAHDRVEQLISGFVSPVPEDVQERLRRYFHDRYAGK